MIVLRGSVFFIRHRELYSPKPHFLVVLNPDIESSPYIVFGVITSGIENAKKRIACNGQPENTLVILTPKDYPELDHDSVIDCNTPVKLSDWEFKKSYSEFESSQKMDMPEEICDAIAQGVLASSMVSEKIKKLLTL